MWHFVANFKDLPRRTASKVLHKAFKIPKNPKYDGYQRSFTFTFTVIFY